jgi:transposase
VQVNCIKNLFKLEDVIIKNITHQKEAVKIYIQLPVIEHECPNCGEKTTKIHDYYLQTITDIPIYFKPTKLSI